MENLVKQSSILEKSGVYSEDGKHRYELSLIYKGIKGKKILVISMNPASSDLMVMDTTSNYLLNNLGSWDILRLLCGICFLMCV